MCNREFADLTDQELLDAVTGAFYIIDAKIDNRTDDCAVLSVWPMSEDWRGNMDRNNKAPSKATLWADKVVTTWNDDPSEHEWYRRYMEDKGVCEACET